jgi:hypothetical protein
LKPLLDVTTTPEFEHKLRSEIDREIFRAEVRDALQPTYSGPKRPTLEVWPGKVYELARKVRDDFDAGRVQANSLHDAFGQASKRYVQANGRHFTAKSLGESLRQKQNKDLGNPR